MPTTVGQHAVAAFTSPVNGTSPIDANTVRGNDNTVRVAYVDHDADPGIHVQSSTLASRPVAGTAGRKWITADAGSYKLWFDDGTRWHEIGNDAIDLAVVAGENLVKGDVISVTGFNNGLNVPIVAKYTGSAPAFGIVAETIANGAQGYIINTGLINDVNTQALGATGTILYPAATGTFTATKPVSGEYQVVAYVLRQNTNNGALYVEFSAPRIVERSDNTASTVVLRDASGNFAAGTITAGALTSTGLVTFASLKGTGSTTVTDILNDNTMATSSATTLATSSSVKAYVDAQVGANNELSEVLANGNTTGANDIIVSAGQKIRTPAIAAGDGTASATIADSTGVMTIGSSVLTTTDINGGTIDGTTIGGSTAAAGTFTDLNATTVDTTNIEVTNVKAKDGTASIAIADSTGVATITAAPILSALTASQAVFTDSNKALVSNAITGTGNVVMSASPTLTGTVNVASLTASGTITGALTGNVTGNASTATTLQTARNINGVSFNGSADITVTAAAGTLSGNTLASNVLASSLTSVGTLSSLTVSGDLTVDTSTLKVDSTNNAVGIGTTTPTTYASGTLTVSKSTASGDVALSLRNAAAPVGGGVQGTIINFLNDSGATNALAYIQSRSNDGGSNGETSLRFGTYNGSALGERMRIDASGNLGLGVTPSAWTSAVRVIDLIGGGGIYAVASSPQTAIVTNAYNDGAWKYKAAGARAALLTTDSGTFSFFNTASTGSAGGAITFGDAKMTLDASGNLGLGSTSTPTGQASNNRVIQLYGAGTSNRAQIHFTNSDTGETATDGTFLGIDGTGSFYIVNRENAATIFENNGTERARITSGGIFGVGITPTGSLSDGYGFQCGPSNGAIISRDDNQPLVVNRGTSDGVIVSIRQDAAEEGTISVSGNTVSYNAFAGSHWSQLEDGSKPNILRGTVIEAIDELCEWPGEQNERLPKCKVSDTAGSKKVYGVFMDWDNDWTETNDLYVTAVGAFVCRISADVTVEQGDLLESNGDGTARVQADDVIRSSTIGKVTSTVKTHEYEDGTYCVPTVLYCG